MKTKHSSTPSDTPNPFLTQHQADVIGILSGLDRLRFKGSLPQLYYPRTMDAYGPSALDDLHRLPARERAQILRKIERLRQGLHGNLKRLHQAEAMYRLRMGDYRVLFDVAGTVIVIRRVGNRKDVYD